MKVKVFILCLFLFFTSGTLCFGTVEAKQQPIAALPEPVFTFDSALDGDQVTHDFIIQNKGTAELKVNRVQTG